MTHCRICTRPTVAVGPEDHEVICRSCFSAAAESAQATQPPGLMTVEELQLLIRAASPALPLPDAIFTTELSAQLERLSPLHRRSLVATWTIDGRVRWELEQQG